jgi:Protein of unknown function (DUF4235)
MADIAAERSELTGRTVHTSTSAKILYRPVGLVGSLIAGMVAGMLARQVYRRVVPGDQTAPPRALESEYSLRQVLVGALIQGAIFAAVKALVDRGGARAFEKLTGDWPGS